MTPVTEIDQLKTQNALLLRALQRANRERDLLVEKLAALQPEPPTETEASR